MTKIFISYRRSDTGFGADRVHEAALDYVSDPADVFMDIDGIPPGVDFVDFISDRVAECDVLFALIGRDWLNASHPETDKRRLDDPDDFVRIEIASALSRNIPVVPVLMGGAPMPRAEDLPADLKSLARRNASHLGRASFKTDMAGLMEGLGIARNTPDPIIVATEDPIERERTFNLIRGSLSRTDYRKFLKRYSDGPEAFEAERRIDQLESWASLDKTDIDVINSWLLDRSDRVFDALGDKARAEIHRLSEKQTQPSTGEQFSTGEKSGTGRTALIIVISVLGIAAAVWASQLVLGWG